MKKLIGFIVMFTALSAFAVDGVVKKASVESLKKGADAIIKLQAKDGSFGGHPAITALVVTGLHKSGIDAKKEKEVTDKAFKYILSFKQPNGSIFPLQKHLDAKGKKSGFYPNYSTSIVLMALATVNRAEDKAVMLKARRYLQSSQFKDASKIDYGGIGYGKTGRADLSNFSWTAAALKMTDYLDKEPHSKDPDAAKKVDEMWKIAQKFLSNCQNLKDHNNQKNIMLDDKNKGGFYYRPNESKVEGADENKMLSGGSMTYAGLMSMLYANISREDIRVKSAIAYLQKNYTIEENPGMGQQGMFYYIYIMTKALSVYGSDTILDAKGAKHKWREDVLNKLLKMQKKDGTWSNGNGRFFESLPELAGAYALITMKAALK